MFDADLRYLSAGGLGLAEVGLSRAILEGHTIFEVFPPATVAIIEPLYRRALAGHESRIDVPYEGRIFLQRLGPLYDADGGIVAGMGFTQDVTAVRDAERRLTDAESIGGVGSWEIDLVTEAVTWSAGLFELYGLNQDQFDGNYTAALKCIHPGDRARVNTGVEACARTGEPLRDRYRITRGGDDALRWIETRGEAQYDNGVRVRITGAIADVTDQVDAAAAAAAAQSFQHAVFTASPDIISVWDFPTGSVLWSNCSIPARLGYSGEDAAAMGASPARFLVVADDLKQYEAGLAAARDATDDQVLQSDFRMARKDGTIRWFSRLSAPLQRDENRRVTRIVGITRDTTDERTVQAALVESQNRFHQLADTVTVSFILRSLDPPAFLYISPGFAKIFGFDPMSVWERPGEGVRRIVHPDDYEWAMEQYWEKAAAGVAAQAEFRIVRPDGEIRWISASSAPVVDVDGVVRRTASTSEDITDRKCAEATQLAADKLAQANTVKDRMLSRMSHELRTPLNAVLGFAQLLELDELSTVQRNSVEHILDGGRHLVGLVEDILDLTKIQGEAMDLSTEPFAITELLAGTTALMQPVAMAGGVTLEYDPGLIGGLLVQADRRRLRQVVLNLLSNAIKFNRPGGRVEITGQTMQTHLEIRVTDTGRGIAAEHLPRLFTPFDRLTAPAAGIDGTGLGLTLSRDLMQAMGGTLRATSTEGVGSTFTATVPLAQPFS